MSSPQIFLNTPAHLIPRGKTIRYQRYPLAMFPASHATITVVTARCYICPIEIPFLMDVDAIVVIYGTPSVGNCRAAIYEDNGDLPDGGGLIVESASVAKSGVNRKQEVPINITNLEPGIYWLVYQSDENTTLVRVDRAVEAGTVEGRSYNLGAYGAFTDPCPVTVARNVPRLFLKRVNP